MRQKKGCSGIKAICSVIALILLLQMPAAAETSAENEVTGSSVPATFTGQIPATMLQIELPTEIVFTVDPNLILNENGYNQVTDNGFVEIENGGGAVSLSIIGFDDLIGVIDKVELLGGEDGNIDTAKFQYFNSMDEVLELAASNATRDGRRAGVMVSLWLTGETSADEYKTPTSIADLQHQAITPAKFEAGGVIPIGTIPQASKVTLQVYCFAKTNFTGRGFSFSLAPILKAELNKGS